MFYVFAGIKVILIILGYFMGFSFDFANRMYIYLQITGAALGIIAFLLALKFLFKY